MIINSQTSNCIKLTVDENDLEKSGISLIELKCKPQIINKLLLKTLNIPLALVKNSQIITYNFKVFNIQFFLNQN